MTTYRLDFGPEWSKGIVTIEPPKIGKAFIGRVPAVDEAGNDRAGIGMAGMTTLVPRTSRG